MEWLNHHHLLYFWTVARQGSLARASSELRLAPSTISGQIHSFEENLGEKLFSRSGRRLVLTEIGHLVYRYAEEIFTLSHELQDALKGRPVGRPLRLVVGVADVLPKLVARRLIQPALQLSDPVRLVCREDKPDRLLAALSIHELDVVLSDSPVSPSIKIRAFNHLLGECGVTFFATKTLAKSLRRGFPTSIDGAPVLLPTEDTAVRRSLDQWFHARGIRPQVMAEFEDSALLNVFAQTGLGAFMAPSFIAAEVQRQYQVEAIGQVPEVRDRFYAISVERKLKHPAVLAIAETARQVAFA